MPIVDLAPPDLTAVTDRPKGFAVTPGEDEINHGSDTPQTPWISPAGGSDVMSAAFRHGNLGGSALARQDWGAEYEPEEPGFKPWDAIKGTKYEQYADRFYDIRSTPGADARKRQIDMEEDDNSTLASAPWYMRFPAQLLAGGADIPSLLPGGAFVRTAGGGISVMRTAAVTGLAAGAGVGLQEAGLHGTQQLRTIGESIENIGASVFLGGLLGAGGAKLLSRSEWNKSVTALNEDLARAGPVTEHPIFIRVRDQMMATGRVTEDEANQTAAVVAARYITRAQRLGKSDAEALAQGIEIRSGGDVVAGPSFDQTDETIRGASYTVGGKTYEAPNHILAMDKAVEDLGLGGYDDLIDLQPGDDLTQKLRAHREAGDGFVTSTGRVVTREEAKAIGEAAGQGKATAERGIKSEDLKFEQRPVRVSEAAALARDKQSAEDKLTEALKSVDINGPVEIMDLALSPKLEEQLPAELKPLVQKWRELGSKIDDRIEAIDREIDGSGLKTSDGSDVQTMDLAMHPDLRREMPKHVQDLMAERDALVGTESTEIKQFEQRAGGVPGREGFGKLDSDPNERALTVNDILHPQTPSLPARSRNVEDIAKDLMVRGSDALKNLGIKSGRIEESEPRTDELLSRAVASEVKAALGREGQNAADWYTHKIREAMAVVSTIHPEIATDVNARFGFTSALSITSQGETVPSNVRLAERVYNEFKETGKFPTNVVAKNGPAMNDNFAKLNHLIDTIGLDETQKFLHSQYTVKELKDAGWRVGGENVNTTVYGSAILGPKIGGGFFQNLNGNYNPVTMDLWFMRAWGRLTGTLVGATDIAKPRARFEAALEASGSKVPKALPELLKAAEDVVSKHEKDFSKNRSDYDSGAKAKSELTYAAERLVKNVNGINEQPSSGSQRVWMRERVERAREILADNGINVTNADLQAIWWYPEKELYGKLGGRDSEGINVDYASALRNLAAKRGIDNETIERAVGALDHGPGSSGAADVGRGAQEGGPGYSQTGAQAEGTQGTVERDLLQRQGGISPEGEPLGRVTFANNKRIIDLFKSANASTGMHEFSHIWLEEMIADAARADAPQGIKDDLAATLKWLGVEKPEDIGTSHHEQFARGFEQYLRDGKAPSSALESAFAKFKDWLTAIYKSMTELGAPISDEMRGVFDRMLATDQEIAASGSAGPGVPASIGAAANEPTSLEANTIAGRAARGVAGATRRLNPLLRIMQSPSAAARDIGGKLFENPVYLNKNFAGVASEHAVETFMKEWNAGLRKVVESTPKVWKDYRKGGGSMTLLQFREAVGRAMRRGDESDIPQVAADAKAWRSQVFDPLKEAAIKAGLLPEDVSVTTAASYFSRMYNRNRIIGEGGRFKGIVTDYYNKAIGNEYEKATTSFNTRMAKLDQEKEDITLSPEQRAQRLNELETAAEEHEAAGAAYQDLAEKADRLADIAADVRRLKAAGDTMVARQNMASAKVEAAAIKEAGGKDLQDFIAKRRELRARRANVDLGAAGLSERSQQIMETLADLEEANQRSLGRLVKKGQKLERELDKLDPDVLAERISALKDNFAEISKRSDAAAERADKAIAGIKEEAAKRAEKTGEEAATASASAAHGDPEQAAANRAAAKAARDKANAALAEADAKITARLEKEAASHRARSERMARIAERMEVAEGFDREGAVAELRAGIEKAIAETSHTSLARGERAQRLQDRLASLDPKRIEDRTKAIDAMKKDLERAYYDRWEIKNLGKGVDPATKTRPDFSDSAREIADTVYNTLTGRTEEGVRPEFMTIGTRGPMKDRTFNIPDELIEDFLEHDVDLVGRRYVRVMGADVEMKNKFGSVDMKDQIADIRANYDRMRDRLPDGPQKLALSKAETRDIDDITGLRDLLRGTRQEAPWGRSYAKIARVAGYLNYVRTMGEIVLGNFNDAVRPAMVHGLMPYMKTIRSLATNLPAIKMSIEEAKLAGNVAERVLASRMATLADLTDPYAARGPIEAFLENMSNALSKWNGIRLWNDMQKSITAVMTQNRILQAVEKRGLFEQTSRLDALAIEMRRAMATGDASAASTAEAEISAIKKAGGSQLKSFAAENRPYLAIMGIDQGMAERIQAQFASYGQNIDGVRVANTEKWTDPEAVRIYRAAMNKDIDSIIVTAGKADLPLFVNTPTGKLLAQFQGYTLASHQRILLRGLQEKPTRFIGGVVANTAMGMAIVYLKALTANRVDKLESMNDNPGWWIAEGFDRAGIIAVPVELANRVEKMTGFNPVKGPMKVFDKGSAESQKNQNRDTFGTVLGPAVGLGEDIFTTAKIPHTLWEGKDVSQAQKNAAVRLMPFQSYYGVRSMLNYVVNPQH